MSFRKDSRVHLISDRVGFQGLGGLICSVVGVIHLFDRLMRYGLSQQQLGNEFRLLAASDKPICPRNCPIL
jgi:hypothetical protein